MHLDAVNCRRCGRPLSNPKSVGRGYGPVCWKKVNAEKVKSLAEVLTGDYGKI